jgi:hypothetical protein
LRAGFVARVPDGDRLGGRVETVNEAGVTLTGRGGQPITITAGPGTWLAISGEDFTWAGDPPGREMLEPGTWLLAFGTLDGSGQALAADTLVVMPGSRLRVIRGEVTGLIGTGFTIETRFGDELTVLVGENTRFRLPGAADPGLDDLAVGDRLVVFGRPAEDGQSHAWRVVGRPHTVFGQITAIDGSELTVDTYFGRTLTVLTGSDTHYLIPGTPDASLDDFAVGDRVLIGGRWAEDGSLQALWLAKRLAD